MFFFPDEKGLSYGESIFENIKHINEYGQEFWYARELQKVLEYTEWRNFHKAINKAMEACDRSEIEVSDHFVEVNKIVEVGVDITSVMPNGGKRILDDFELSRTAAVL